MKRQFFIVLLLLIWLTPSCQNEVTKDTGIQPAISSVSTDKIPNIESMSNEAKLKLLKSDENFIILTNFQLKFLDKIIESNIDLSDPKIFLSPTFLSDISYNQDEFIKDQQNAKIAAEKVVAKFSINLNNNEGCISCSIKEGDNEKIIKAAKVLKKIKKSKKELSLLRETLGANQFRSASNYKKLNLSNVASSESSSDTDCSYAYYGCVIGCAASTGGVLGALCVYVCYCGFCDGPTVKTVCGK